jgi:hypothetical protein
MRERTLPFGRLDSSFRQNPWPFRGGAVEIRRVSKIHASGQVLFLDLLLVTAALQPVWEGRETMEWDFGKISVVSRDSLISLKSLHPPQSLTTTG